MIEKVVAYITWDDRLLVFSHPGHPEAGIQVPAGTVHPGEAPEMAVLREAYEETGLAGLEIHAFLGVREFDLSDYGVDQIHRRYFFHLVFHGASPARWRHFENDPSDGAAPVEFELFWVRYPDEVPELIAGFGEMMGDGRSIQVNRVNRYTGTQVDR